MFISKDKSDQGNLHGGGGIFNGAWRKWLGLEQWEVGKDEYNDRLGRGK